MPNRPATFTQADVTRAVKGAVAAGLTVREVFATQDGVRVICDGDKKTKPEANTFDEVLND